MTSTATEAHPHHRGNRAAANTIILLGSNAVARVLGGVLVVVTARMLGPETVGIYNILLLYQGLFKFFAEMGLVNVVIRDVGRDPDRAQEYLADSVFLSLVCGTVFAALMLGAMWLNEIHIGHKDPGLLWLAAVSGVTLVFGAMVNLMGTVFNGLEMMGPPSWWLMVMRAAMLISGVAAIWAGTGIEGLLVTGLAATLLQFFGLWWSIRKGGLGLMAGLRLDRSWQMVREALPFAAMGAISLIYIKGDAVLLSMYGPGGTVEVAYYTNVYMFFEFLVQIPVQIGLAVMPMMSAAYIADRTRMWHQYRMVERFQAFLGAPILVLSCLEGTRIMALIFGQEFARAGLVMPFLAVSLCSVFLTMPGLNIIKNSRLVWAFVVYQIFITAVNLGLNFIYIPKYGFIAAGWMSAGTKIVDLAMFSLFLRVIAEGSTGFLRAVSKPAVAGVVMAGAAYWLHPQPLAVVVAGSSVTYGLVYLAIGGISREEKAYWRRLIAKAREKAGPLVEKMRE